MDGTHIAKEVEQQPRLFGHLDTQSIEDEVQEKGYRTQPLKVKYLLNYYKNINLWESYQTMLLYILDGYAYELYRRRNQSNVGSKRRLINEFVDYLALGIITFTQYDQYLLQQEFYNNMRLYIDTIETHNRQDSEVIRLMLLDRLNDEGFGPLIQSKRPIEYYVRMGILNQYIFWMGVAAQFFYRIDLPHYFFLFLLPLLDFYRRNAKWEDYSAYITILTQYVDAHIKQLEEGADITSLYPDALIELLSYFRTRRFWYKYEEYLPVLNSLLSYFQNIDISIFMKLLTETLKYYKDRGLQNDTTYIERLGIADNVLTHFLLDATNDAYIALLTEYLKHPNPHFTANISTLLQTAEQLLNHFEVNNELFKYTDLLIALSIYNRRESPNKPLYLSRLITLLNRYDGIDLITIKTQVFEEILSIYRSDNNWVEYEELLRQYFFRIENIYDYIDAIDIFLQSTEGMAFVGSDVQHVFVLWEDFAYKLSRESSYVKVGTEIADFCNLRAKKDFYFTPPPPSTLNVSEWIEFLKGNIPNSLFNTFIDQYFIPWMYYAVLNGRRAFMFFYTNTAMVNYNNSANPIVKTIRDVYNYRFTKMTLFLTELYHIYQAYYADDQVEKELLSRTSAKSVHNLLTFIIGYGNSDKVKSTYKHVEERREREPNLRISFTVSELTPLINIMDANTFIFLHSNGYIEDVDNINDLVPYCLNPDILSHLGQDSEYIKQKMNILLEAESYTNYRLFSRCIKSLASADIQETENDVSSALVSYIPQYLDFFLGYRPSLNVLYNTHNFESNTAPELINNLHPYFGTIMKEWANYRDVSLPRYRFHIASQTLIYFAIILGLFRRGKKFSIDRWSISSDYENVNTDLYKPYLDEMMTSEQPLENTVIIPGKMNKENMIVYTEDYEGDTAHSYYHALLIYMYINATLDGHISSIRFIEDLLVAEHVYILPTFAIHICNHPQFGTIGQERGIALAVNSRLTDATFSLVYTNIPNLNDEEIKMIDNRGKTHSIYQHCLHVILLFHAEIMEMYNFNPNQHLPYLLDRKRENISNMVVRRDPEHIGIYLRRASTSPPFPMLNFFFTYINMDYDIIIRVLEDNNVYFFSPDIIPIIHERLESLVSNGQFHFITKYLDKIKGGADATGRVEMCKKLESVDIYNLIVQQTNFCIPAVYKWYVYAVGKYAPEINTICQTNVV